MSKIRDQAGNFLLSSVPGPGEFLFEIDWKGPPPGVRLQSDPLEPVRHFTADDSLLRQANAEDFRKKKLYENHPYEEPAAIFYSGHRLPSTTTSGAGSG
jgi:hypothetical protein